MKIITRKQFLKALGASVAISAMTACADANAASTSSATTDSSMSDVASQSEDASTVQELVFWSTKEDVYQDLLDEFETQTGIKVTGTYMGGYDDMVDKVMAGIAGNNLPDVAQLGQRHGIAQMYDSGSLMPIEGIISQELIDDIFEGFWIRFTYKEKKIVLPFANSMPMLYYNKELFEQAGVTPPTTLEEIVITAKTIKEKTGVYGFSLNSDTAWYINGLTFSSDSKPVLDDVANINTPEMKYIYEQMHKMATVDKSMPANQHGTAKEDFCNGNIGMMLTSCSSYYSMKNTVGENFTLAVAQLPHVTELDVPMGGNGLGIFAKDVAKQKAVAMFIEFMLDKDRVANNSLNSGYIPVTYAAMETDAYQKYLEDVNCQVIHDQLQYLGGAAVNPADSLVWGELGGFLDTVEANAEVDFDAELADINQTVQDYLDDYAG